MFTLPLLRRALGLATALTLALVLLPAQVRPAAALDAPTFIAKTVAWAQAEERTYGVPTSVALAQAMLESGMGESGLTKNANNWFGIKCFAKVSPYQNGCYSISTREYDANGNMYTTTAKFRKYDTPELSFIDHGYFLRNVSRYANAFNYTNDPDRFIVEVHLAGYATDPTYANMIINVMVRHNLYQYNLTPPSTAPSELAIRPHTQAFVDGKANVNGLLSPGGAGRTIRVQAKTGSTWTTTQTAVAGSRGQFSIPLDYLAGVAGKVTYRVQAVAAQGVLTSQEFTLTRVPRVTVEPIVTVMETQVATLRGVATGTSSGSVKAQVLLNGTWTDHSSGQVGSNGSFSLPLTMGQGGAGSWQFRAQVTTSAGVVHTSAAVTGTWVKDVYTTAGTHSFNGRQWRTRCEPYSATTRCFTDIWATTTTYTGGRFVTTQDWVFNNMTYLPSERSLWKDNPLGGYGSPGPKEFTWSSGGREWRAECDTVATGRGGCRAYIRADVVVATRTASGASAYRWEKVWLFNNIVRFS